ncbi:MAG: hypothetical protein J0H42_32610, partial [Rhizobiales bacterium]|nr:hypothetical protein [Hyphomicrobiales bacterium]
MAFLQDAMSVPVVGTLGSKVSLLDLLKQQYGDDWTKLNSVQIQWRDPAAMTPNAQYWDQNNHQNTMVLNGATPIAINTNFTVNKDQFANVFVQVGNNIASNVNVLVTETSDANWTGESLNVTTLLKGLDLQLPADHVPTAADIVSAANLIASSPDNKAFAPNDCHNIATAIAASAGATLDPLSAHTGAAGDTSPANEQSGFWRIAFQNGSAGANWESVVQAGDIVRMQRSPTTSDGGVHTVTVVSGLNADGKHPGQIEVVDNANGIISKHWQDFDKDTVPGSVTVYRLTTDGMYLNDQSADTGNSTILATNFNNLIKGGSGNNTLVGGHGNDTLDGGAGDDTAVFTGKQSDYKITVVDGKTAILADLRAGSPDGTDTIKNVEHVKFGDGSTVNFGDLKNTVTPPPPVAGSVSISDKVITEGNNGSHIETFTVTRTGGSAAFDVNFATKDGSATTADGDYVGNSGKVHFDAGVNSQTISIVVNGDTKVEANETFSVNLSGATNGATISKAVGVGTIMNDDVPAPVPVAGSVSIGDKVITEGNNGSHIETFTLTRTGGSAAFDVNFATKDGTATTADGDYVGNSGKVHFDAGVNTQTISVVVNGDTKVEA